MSRPGGSLAGLLLVSVYTTLWLLAMVVMGVVVAVAMLVLPMGPQVGGGLSHAGMCLLLTMQFPAMLVLVPIAHELVERRLLVRLGYREPAWIFESPPSLGLAWWGLALMAGLTVGWVSGGLATWLQDLFPSLTSGSLEQISRHLTEGWWVWRGWMALMVVVGAGVAEELLFRDFFWRSLSRWLDPVWVWIATSVLFAAYHMDPLQSVALLPTALLLGWFRWRSGSVWPGVLLHALNNALGVTAAWVLPEDTEVPLAIIAVSAVCVAGVMWRTWRMSLTARRGSSLELS